MRFLRFLDWKEGNRDRVVEALRAEEREGVFIISFQMFLSSFSFFWCVRESERRDHVIREGENLSTFYRAVEVANLQSLFQPEPDPVTQG